MFERNHVPKNDCCMYDNFSIVQLVCWLFTNIGNIFVVKLCTGEKANVCSVNVCIGNGQSWPTLMTKNIYQERNSIQHIHFHDVTFYSGNYAILVGRAHWASNFSTFMLKNNFVLFVFDCYQIFCQIHWLNQFCTGVLLFPFVRMLWIGAWFL